MSFDEIKSNISDFCLNCGKCDNSVHLSSVSCFDEIPDGCVNEGFLFMQRESIKQKIRKFKEEVMDLKLQLNELKNHLDKEKILAKIEEKESVINSFAQFGSTDW